MAPVRHQQAGPRFCPFVSPAWRPRRRAPWSPTPGGSCRNCVVLLPTRRHAAQVIIRREAPHNQAAVRAVHAAAFRPPGGGIAPEAQLVEGLRGDGDVVAGLSLVAELDTEVVGHVVCSRGQIDGQRAVAEVGRRQAPRASPSQVAGAVQGHRAPHQRTCTRARGVGGRAASLPVPSRAASPPSRSSPGRTPEQAAGRCAR